MAQFHLQQKQQSRAVGAGRRPRRGEMFALLVLLLCVGNAANGRALQPLQAPRPQITQRVTVAVLSFGSSNIGRLSSEKFAASLGSVSGIAVLDQDQAQTAARGAGYEGSLNLSLVVARDLGAALGCDFFILGDAQTLRRSPSTGPEYFEAYTSIFAVSARTGRLIDWDRPNFQGTTPTRAEQALLLALSGSELRRRFASSLGQVSQAERDERAFTTDQQVPVIEEAPDNDEVAAAEGLRLPRPYRRFVPNYPATAATAEVEATVDVLVDLDANGEVVRTVLARWAGFGLDEATVETVRRLHFFPAQRNGVAIPIRVLLRYNFRKPAK